VRAGQTPATRTLQRINRKGFELLYRRTEGRHTGTGGTLRQGGQNSRPLLAKNDRKCRVGRVNNRRYVPGIQQNLPRTTGDGEQRSIDLLRDFSETCREEFASLRTQF
jgi:hypothetical protein